MDSRVMCEPSHLYYLISSLPNSQRVRRQCCSVLAFEAVSNSSQSSLVALDCDGKPLQCLLEWHVTIRFDLHFVAGLNDRVQ